ncbi:unnamed protein product [Linum tenue]|uniref:Uncharacterized protein n=1 Tax=Linum tenue TaxID=586396 RepID=A0AAV0K6Y1_9ROSI|nr:unnamed protein product [Linum tenue]
MKWQALHYSRLQIVGYARMSSFLQAPVFQYHAFSFSHSVCRAVVVTKPSSSSPSLSKAVRERSDKESFNTCSSWKKPLKDTEVRAYRTDPVQVRPSWKKPLIQCNTVKQESSMIQIWATTNLEQITDSSNIA